MNLASQNFEQLKSSLFKQIEVIKREEKLAELKVTTRRRTWHIQIQLLSGSKVLPEIKLLDKDLIGKLAHVNACGTICVSDEEGALIDYYRDDFISNYLEFVIERLEEFYLAAKVENFDALYDEFEGNPPLK